MAVRRRGLKTTGGRRTREVRRPSERGRGQGSHRVPRPGLIRALGVLSIALVAVLGLCLFLTSSTFGVKDILVLGSVHLTTSEIVAACDVDLGTNILKVQTAEIRDNLRTLPRVADATVSRRLPDRLVVEVVEREGVLLVPCLEEFVEVDASGYPVEFHRFVGAIGLPIATGLSIDGVTLGSRLENDGLSVALCCAAALGGEGRLAVSEIHVGEDGALTLYTRDGIPVYFGTAATLDLKVSAFLSILPDLGFGGYEVAYVDVRYPRYPVVGSTQTVFRSDDWPGDDPDAILLGGP